MDAPRVRDFMLLENPQDDAEGLVLIEDSVLVDIQRYVQDDRTLPESGGILLGYRRQHHLHIVEATIPAKGDSRGRFHFWRRDRSHQREATKAWKKSGKTIDYLGEWHTHPERHPSPSVLDLREWRKICVTRQNCMVFVIVGIGSFRVGVGKSDDIKFSRPVDYQSAS